VIPEPPGGAHRDHQNAAKLLRTYLSRALRQLRGVPIDELVNRRYDRFRAMGVFAEG